MKRPIFALADCNNFYASCERVFNPSLINQPIVILSNNDGCIIARSNEAKALGIKMGEPVYLARHTILRHKVHVFSANFTLYGDLSHRVMETLKTFAPRQEVYSIDEAFLDLSNFAGLPPEQLKQYGETMRNTVYRQTKITVSIGIAETKTLAKLAAELAKKSPKAQGVLNLTHSKHQELALAKTPIDSVWGVGRQYADKLKGNNIHTALDLRQAEDKWILKHFGVVLMRTVMELRGISCIPLTQTPPPKKTIMTSRSFGYPIQTLRELKQAVATYTARTGEKLREEKLLANQIEVFIKTNRFRPNTPQYAQSMALPLPVSTHTTHELIHYSLMILEKIFQEGYDYHKAGVIVSGLVPMNGLQQSLFDPRGDRSRSASLMKAFDQINQQFGSGSLRYASEGLEKRWKMKQESKSQRFTTHWDELPWVHA